MSALDGREFSKSVPTPFLPVPTEREAECTQNRLVNFREKQNISILPGFEPRTSQPVA
jgi:hypothetical protein